MKHASDTDTIVALATPPGRGGVGILRLSGPKAPDILAKVYRGKRPVSEFETHRLYFGELQNPTSQRTLDQGLAVWMKAPGSYTGEEVVEFHAHGGPFVLNLLLESLVEAGLRLAEPGEFTRRAFFNAKLDLLQAEAVGELIHAQSEAALRNARAQLQGRLSEAVTLIRERLLTLLSRVEAAIDFPEEDIEILAAAAIHEELAALKETLEVWLEKFRVGRLIQEGIRIALVGRPNVGKSSLLNRLLGEDRAIVHDRPGTTRDVIEAKLEWGGVAVQLFDTAGIRQGEEAVECEGIQRSKKAASEADLTLWLVDASEALTPEDQHILEFLPEALLVLGNKMDRGLKQDAFPKTWPIPDRLQGKPWILVSAKTGEGLEKLEAQVLEFLGLGALEEIAEGYLNNARHRDALRQGCRALARAQSALTEKKPTECLAFDLREAAESLERILGKITQEEVLDKIFADFCIGK